MQRLCDMVPALRGYFTERLGADREVELEGPDRITTGNSRAMLRVTVRGEVGGVSLCEDYVLRVEQGGVFGTESSREVRLMQALARTGIPVARVRWYESEGSVIGAPFFVMDRVPGIGENPGLASVTECVRLLAKQHDLDWERADLGFLGAPGSREEAALRQIDHWEEIYRAATFLPVPLLEEGAAWLRRNAPTAERISLVHGDPGPGNFMFEGDHITAITDWEFAHLGDPDEDWVYMATLRGPGAMSRDDWKALYAREAGVEICEDRWRYWEAFNQFKGACANITALRLFSDGVNPMPNMAAVGTSLHLVFVNRLAEIVASHF